MNLDEMSERVSALTTSRASVLERITIERKHLKRLRRRERDLKEALTIAQAVAEKVQTTAHSKIADIVTRSLATIFDDPYTFKLNFDQKRGRTEATFKFERDGVEIDPMAAAGGGVVDIAAFALRLSCLLLSRPALRRTLVLDEPFRFLSSEYHARALHLLEMLSKELGCQFVVVTHLEAFKKHATLELS